MIIPTFSSYFISPIIIIVIITIVSIVSKKLTKIFIYILLDIILYSKLHLKNNF